ncbi:MAG TPA: DUF2156 domain-containing protein [Streptosporangiaceae bacterium]
MTETLVSASSIQRAIHDYSDADNPSAFLALNRGNSVFTADGLSGVIVYRSAGRYLVQLGGPFASHDSYEDLLQAFMQFATEQGRSVVSIQLQAKDAEIYARHGHTVNQVGASYAVDLSVFSLRGTRFMQLRNKISRAFRAGLTVAEADVDDYFDHMKEIDHAWLSAKGEHTRQLEYLVGEYGGEMQRYRRLFVGMIDGKLAGYISYSPVYGTRPGWMHDLSRRRPELLPGIMEAINKTAIDKFQAEQARWLHFGFTPFTSLDDKLEMPGHSPGFGLVMRLLWQHGEAVYPAQTQLAYKEKWGQSVTLPEYIAFQGRASITAFAHVFRACNAF